MRRDCLREREKGWSEREDVLYLALRRGLLLGEAQVRRPNEIQRYLASGALPTKLPRRTTRHRIARALNLSQVRIASEWSV